jgi:hypothetical protein
LGATGPVFSFEWPGGTPVTRFVDTRYPTMTGATHTVAAGESFQDALNAAAPGDTIELEVGATFSGPFVLPRKDLPAGSEPRWILIRSAAPPGTLPPAGTRIDPSHSPFMATLESETGSVLSAAPGAHHYRIEGIRIRPAESGGSMLSKLTDRLKKIARGVDPGPMDDSGAPFLHNLVDLGTGAEAVDDLPHHIVFDRCYIHGHPVIGARRGIALNSGAAAVINSHLSDFREVGADSQAIVGWSGSGPFKIVNNTLEAAGENIMFGGATPEIEHMISADIEIRGNHLFKPLRWKRDHPEFEGTEWSVKNLLELKSAKRVHIEGNLLEHSWPHAQTGFAVLFTVRNARGAIPWATIRDVLFRNNVVRQAAGGINVLGMDSNGLPSRKAKRLLIDNNLFLSIGDAWGDGRLFQLLRASESVVISNNTAQQAGNIITSQGLHEAFRFVGNVMPHNRYGVIGTGATPGLETLERDFPGAQVVKNVIIGGKAERYPPGNEFPAELDVFEASAGADLHALCSALGTANPPNSTKLGFCRPGEGAGHPDE